jgi:hypothetical protein
MQGAGPATCTKARDAVLLGQQGLPLVIAKGGGQDAPQMSLMQDEHMLQTLLLDIADEPLEYGFCHGDRGAIMTSCMPMCRTRGRKAAP